MRQRPLHVMRTCSIFIAFLLSLKIFNCSALDACTGLQLSAKDGSIIHGRTLEFGVKLPVSIAVIPKNYAFEGTTPQGKGIEYTSKYAAIGAILFNENAIMDGINEEGLSVGAFYFPGFAEYADITADNRSQALAPLEFPNWLLTQYSSVDEVKANLTSIHIVATISSDWGNIAPPMHYIVYDKMGKCIVIEPREGKLKVYDNPFGVITNSPNFDWHMSNLRNYINLRANNVAPLTVKGITLAPFGQGSGMVGLPGDFTPPSRLVRAAIYSYTAIPSKNSYEAVLQAFHLLNQFDIPIGIARETDKEIIHTDYTMVTCVRDPQNLHYYFKTYEDQNLQRVDLKLFDFNADDIKKVALHSQQTIVDISSKLK